MCDVFCNIGRKESIVQGLSVAIAGDNALASAFVVWRGFESSLYKAAKFGYNGVELALHRAKDIQAGKLDALLRENGLVVSAISTGQVFADGGLCLTSESMDERRQTLDVLLEMVELSGSYGKTLNLGRVRGSICSDKSEGYFLESVEELCEEAEKHGVTIILEPVNRYEINFVNNLDEGVALIRKTRMKNLMLMPDVFHMNIEDDSITGSLERNKDYVHYIHLADSNRYAPGRGHLDFDAIFNILRKIDFAGWASVEILPKPSPDEAAEEAVRYLLPYIKEGGKAIA